MAVMMIMKREKVTPEQYEAARRTVNWEGDVPEGGMFHVASFNGDTLHVTDVWESAEELQSFVENRLLPGTAQLGIQTQPEVQVYPVHAIFTPAYRPA